MKVYGVWAAMEWDSGGDNTAASEQEMQATIICMSKELIREAQKVITVPSWSVPPPPVLSSLLSPKMKPSIRA